MAHPPDPVLPSFMIRFSSGRAAPALRLPPDGDLESAISALNLKKPSPVIMLSGGAGAMTQEEVEATREIIAEGIALFAQEHHITIVDGGTVAGIMQMIGDARSVRQYTFPLVGVAPEGRVNYPGHEHPNHDAQLHDGHSHFVLIQANEWGDESVALVGLVRAIAAGQKPMMGILINGGAIAEKDVYLATTQGEDSIPMVILEGTGRKADEIATASRTGETDNRIIKAIVSGGKIEVLSLKQGIPAMRAHLARYFLNMGD